MAQLIIDTGAAANDGTGDPLRTAFTDTNLNFTAIYTAGPVDSNVQITNNTIRTTNTNGNLVLAPNGVGVVQSNVNIVPNSSNIRNLGSSTQRWSSLYVQYASISGNLDLAGTLGVGDLSVTGNLTVTGNTIQIGNLVTDSKTIQLSNTASTANAANGSGITVGVNDDIATLLYSNTANAWTTNIGLSSVGNITAPYFFGNGSQLTGLPVPYGNSNVVTLLSGFGSNTIVTTGNISGGNLLAPGAVIATLLTGGNLQVTGGVSGSTMTAVANVTGGNLLTGGLISAAGNVTGNYFIGNGSQLTGVITNTGNVTFNNQAVVGTGDQQGASGLYLAPGTQSVGNLQYLRVRGGDLPTHIHLDTGNNTYFDQYFGDDFKYVKLANTGNIVINTNNLVDASAQWTFGTTGTLTVPAANVIPGRISTQTTLNNEKGFDLSITAGNTDGCTVPGGDMFLSAGVGYNGISHGAGNVNIVTGDRYGNVTGNIWRFDSSGALTLPLGNVRIRGTVGSALAFGLGAGQTSQGNAAVAIGSLAGNNRQGSNSVAIGNTAGAGGGVSTNYVSGAESPSTTLVVVSTTGIGPGMIITGTGFFSNQTVATVTNSTTLEISASADFTPSGTLTFTGSQGTGAVAVGGYAGATNQGSGAVALGLYAGETLQGTQSVAVGDAAGATGQGSNSVAIGSYAASDNQGINAVAIGNSAGFVLQGNSSVAIGHLAGNLLQQISAVAVGASAGAASQGISAVAIGSSAGGTSQGDYAVSMGYLAGQTSQGTQAVAIGLQTGVTSQGAGAVALGTYSGRTGQGIYAVAIGYLAGNTTQGNNSVAMGYQAAITSQGIGAVAIGREAGNAQGAYAVAIGQEAGFAGQSSGAIAIGLEAGNNDQGGDSVAIGYRAGGENQGDNSVAIGTQAGQTTQGEFAVAIGDHAGNNAQGTDAVAIGASAGLTTQGNGAVAFGQGAGETSQGANAVALGKAAGQVNQGINSIAIGQSAGLTNQGNNSIILNATGSALDQTTANTFTVAPVRNDVANIGEVVFYNATSKEITYGNVISVAGNITGGNIITAGNVSGNTAGFAIGYRDVPQISFTANATIATTDAGKHYYSTLSTGNVLTIANNASQGFQVGAAISIVNQGTGNITVAQGSGVTLYLAGNATSGNRSVATFGMATLIKVATDTWFINGTGVS